MSAASSTSTSGPAASVPAAPTGPSAGGATAVRSDPPARPAPASRRVYDHVKRRLLDGTLDDGALLSEGLIADEVGVSRTPVREAFLQLEAEGLLALYPKRGALVLPISAREARDLFAARVLLEGDALRTVLSRPVDPVLERELAAILAEQRALLEADDLVAYADADRRLHRAWVAAAGNDVLLRVVDGLRDRQGRMTIAMLRRGGPRPSQLMAEHEALVAAIVDRDAELAGALLVAHLDAARTSAIG